MSFPSGWCSSPTSIQVLGSVQIWGWKDYRGDKAFFFDNKSLTPIASVTIKALKNINLGDGKKNKTYEKYIKKN